MNAYEFALSCDDVRRITLDLQEPISTRNLSDGATVFVFLGKILGDPTWKQPSLQLLARQARLTYTRYGDKFKQFDAYEDKAAHYLTRVDYTINYQGDVIHVFEWHSLRFISPLGQPYNTEDLNFYRVGEDKLRLLNAMQQSHVAAEVTVDQIITQSRLCTIRPIAFDATQQEQLDMLAPKSRYTPLAFATNTKAIIDYLADQHEDIGERWMTSQMWDYLHRNVVGIPEINYSLPFQPANHILADEGDIAVQLNRSDTYVYEVPMYFLKWSVLIQTLCIIEASHPGAIPQVYLDLPTKLQLSRLDADQSLRETVIKLGLFLTQNGSLGGTDLTGETLRSILDTYVPDQPVLYLARLSELKAGCEYQINYYCNRTTKSTMLDVQYLKNPSMVNQHDRTQFPYKPILIDAEIALKHGQVVINDDRSVTLYCPDISNEPLTLAPHQIFSTIYQVYENLNRVVSTAVQKYGDQRLPPGNELRAETFGKSVHKAYTAFIEKLFQAEANGELLFGYGNFLFDPLNRCLYHIAPKSVYELALLTSQTLYEDPHERDLYSIWQSLRSKTIVVSGISIGSNIAEALVKATAGAKLRLVDMDFTEPGNIFRIARSNLAALTHPLSVNESSSLFEQNYRNKAATLARELLLINPYLQLEIYPEGLSETNVEDVFGGADLIFDEIDNIDFKISLLRMKAREMGIPVMMISDLDGRVAYEYHPYHLKDTPLLNNLDDATTLQLLAAYRSGGKDEFIALLEAMIGSEYDFGPFGDFIHGRRKNFLSSSLPQHGETALGAGYLGSKMAVAYLLGHDIPTRYYLVPPYGAHYRALQVPNKR